MLFLNQAPAWLSCNNTELFHSPAVLTTEPSVLCKSSFLTAPQTGYSCWCWRDTNHHGLTGMNFLNLSLLCLPFFLTWLLYFPLYGLCYILGTFSILSLSPSSSHICVSSLPNLLINPFYSDFLLGPFCRPSLWKFVCRPLFYILCLIIHISSFLRVWF